MKTAINIKKDTSKLFAKAKAKVMNDNPDLKVIDDTVVSETCKRYLEE